MSAPTNDDQRTIDSATSRMVAGAIGERLRSSCTPSCDLPAPLQNLLDEMLRREMESPQQC